MGERRQRQNGSQGGEFQGVMEAEEEKALSDKMLQVRKSYFWGVQNIYAANVKKKQRTNNQLRCKSKQ